MIPSHYIENGRVIKHPFKTACPEFQVVFPTYFTDQTWNFTFFCPKCWMEKCWMENINVLLGILHNTLFRQWWCNQSSMFSNATISYHSIESLQFSFSGCLLFRVPGVVLTSWNLQQRRRCRSLVPKKFPLYSSARGCQERTGGSNDLLNQKVYCQLPCANRHGTDNRRQKLNDSVRWTLLSEVSYLSSGDVDSLFPSSTKRLHHMCDLICVFSGSTSPVIELCSQINHYSNSTPSIRYIRC